MNLRLILICLVMMDQRDTTACTTASFGVIHNVFLKIAQGNTTRINGTCETCLCALVSNPSLFSFNCFRANLTCELHPTSDQDKPFTLVDSITSEYYFISLPTYKESSLSITSTSAIATKMPLSAGDYLWTFDSTFQDLSGSFNTIPKSGSNFSSASITGYGSSLSLARVKSQYLLIPSPQLKLDNQSWTFEAWIYPTAIVGGTQYGIIGQCQTNVSYTCLHLVIRSSKLYLGFFSDDLAGVTTLTASKWYHVAFVFDCVNRTQSIYLNGLIDGSRQAAKCFQGYNQSLTFGVIENFDLSSCFDGRIDQLSFTNRAKSAKEILQDATLVVYYSFDSNSSYDQGSLRINGSLIGNVTYVPGRVGQAMEINNGNQSTFEVHGLVLLGTSGLPYSFSIWIRPYVPQQAAIMHLSALSDGTGWCLPVLGLTSNAQLAVYSNGPGVKSVMGPIVPLNSWTHVAVTYRQAIGMRLYVNGTLKSSLGSFVFSSGGQSMHMFVGSPSSGVGCVAGYNSSGHYFGAVDEFRIYSRELSLVDVATLAYP